MGSTWKPVLFALTAALTAGAASADELEFAGRWQQVYSSDGFCKSCTIGLVQNGSVLTATATDGWSAILQTDNPGHASFATGVGRRRQGSEPIDIGLFLKGDDMHVMMHARDDGGQGRGWLRQNGQGHLQEAVRRQPDKQDLIGMRKRHYLSPCGRGHKINILASAKCSILLVRGFSRLAPPLQFLFPPTSVPQPIPRPENPR